MLAICDYPSLGLGYEIATAVERQGIPVLAMAHKDSVISNSFKELIIKILILFIMTLPKKLLRKLWKY